MEFGELKDVNLREVWPHEAHNFTPWLVNNLERLSEVVGVPLESGDTEVAVGRFSADILARNTRDGSPVLIEEVKPASSGMTFGIFMPNVIPTTLNCVRTTLTATFIMRSPGWLSRSIFHGTGSAYTYARGLVMPANGAPHGWRTTGRC